jgi:hypothetical protein
MPPLARTITYSALIGAGLFAGSPVARAATPAASGAGTPAAAHATKGARESIEQRINSLHASLKITAKEEADWVFRDAGHRRGARAPGTPSYNATI